MNDTMSLGIHRLWKDSFVSTMLPRLPPSFHHHPDEGVADQPPVFRCLDVAGGTGDIALRLLDRAREKYSNRDIAVEIVDLNEGMLAEGRKRVARTLYYNCTSHHQTRSDHELPKYHSHTEMPNPYRRISPTTPSTCTPSPSGSEIVHPYRRS